MIVTGPGAQMEKNEYEEKAKQRIHRRGSRLNKLFNEERCHRPPRSLRFSSQFAHQRLAYLIVRMGHARQMVISYCSPTGCGPLVERSACHRGANGEPIRCFLK